jgi:hypothetical protein
LDFFYSKFHRLILFKKIIIIINFVVVLPLFRFSCRWIVQNWTIQRQLKRNGGSIIYHIIFKYGCELFIFSKKKNKISQSNLIKKVKRIINWDAGRQKWIKWRGGQNRVQISATCIGLTFIMARRKKTHCHTRILGAPRPGRDHNHQVC